MGLLKAMVEQPVPDVTDEDVRRIAIRDFGESQLADVLSILSKYGASPRVHIAVLKLAKSDIAELHEMTKAAIEDFRDVLAWAEYPQYMSEVGFDNISDSTRERIIEDDSKQYRNWLHRD